MRNWKKKCIGLNVPDLRRLKLLGAETGRLRSVVPDLSVDTEFLQVLIGALILRRGRAVSRIHPDQGREDT